MIPSVSKDFALIDVRELEVKFSQMSFIEEEGVPGDSDVIGETWKKTNKDGSRDRRFTNNYQIPIAKYAEIEFRSASGLYEVYQFSNFAAGLAFNQSLIEYQNAMTANRHDIRITLRRMEQFVRVNLCCHPWLEPGVVADRRLQ
jgi:hypothetical protein